jgi:hypothetical protein
MGSLSLSSVVSPIGTPSVPILGTLLIGDAENVGSATGVVANWANARLDVPTAINPMTECSFVL